MEIKKIIDEAIRNGRTITIKYQKYGGEYSERTISNIQPSEEFGEGYIKAYCHLRHEDRTFKISRIISATQVSIRSSYTKYENNFSTSNSIKKDKINISESTISRDRQTPITPIRPVVIPRPITQLSDHVIEDRPSTFFDTYRKEILKPSQTEKKPINTNPSNNKSEGCYIATMAYGDYDHPQVVILRDFRDKVLLSTSLGMVFVRLYYWLSPKLVRILKDHKKTNTLIRKSLDNLIKVIK